jgi:hypothetical protein
MSLTQIKWAALAAVATGFAFTSTAVLGRQDYQKKEEQTKAAVKHFEPAPAVPVPEKHMPRPARTATGGYAERYDGRGDDPRSHRILARLEDPVSMSFANETPLDDVLKYIKQATTTPTFSGIPIYVDPVGLQEAERSLNSTVQIDLEGVPLRRTLQLMLAQLKLAYFVEDGILVITSEDSASQATLPPSMASPPPIFEKLEKAERGELTVDQMKELLEVLKLRNQLKELAEKYGKDEEGGEKVNQTAELLKEVRELIQLLKDEKQGKQEKKPPERKGGLQ